MLERRVLRREGNVILKLRDVVGVIGSAGVAGVVGCGLCLGSS